MMSDVMFSVFVTIAILLVAFGVKLVAKKTFTTTL